MDIIVDPRFRDKIPKPTPEEFRQLEENILADGEIRDPLILWKGTGILIDGHNRWKIYQDHTDKLPFPGVRELPFDDENAATDWMLMNQLGRRNLNEAQIAVLRGQLYKTMKKSVGAPKGNRNAEKQCTQNGNIETAKPTRVSEQMATRLGIGKNTVIRAEKFLDGLEAAERVDPGFKEEVLSGQTKATQSEIAELRNVEPEKMAAAIDKIRNPKRVSFPTGKKPQGSSKSSLIEDIERKSAKETTTKATVQYTLEDLIEELSLIQKEFFDKYYTVLDIHRDIATDTAKARKAVAATMKEFETEWKEVKEIIQ